MSDQNQFDPLNDPVVEEVRAIRQALWKEAGEDFEKYLQLIRRSAAEAMKTMERMRNKGDANAA